MRGVTPSHERKKYADCVIVRNDNLQVFSRRTNSCPVDAETCFCKYSGTERKSVLQAGIKKARHFDVPGLPFDC
jgi:hypothetical protein